MAEDQVDKNKKFIEEALYPEVANRIIDNPKDISSALAKDFKCIALTESQRQLLAKKVTEYIKKNRIALNEYSSSANSIRKWLNEDDGKYAKKLQECLCNIKELYPAIKAQLGNNDREDKGNAENVDNFTNKICDIVVSMKKKEYNGTHQTFKNEAVTEITTYFSKIPGLEGGKARRQASDIFNNLAQEYGEDLIKQNWFNKVVSKIKNMWHGYNPSKTYVNNRHKELADIVYEPQKLKLNNAIKERYNEQLELRQQNNLVLNANITQAVKSAARHCGDQIKNPEFSMDRNNYSNQRSNSGTGTVGGGRSQS